MKVSLPDNRDVGEAVGDSNEGMKEARDRYDAQQKRIMDRSMERSRNMQQDISAGTDFVDRLGELILSRETSETLKAVRKLLAAFGQGLEITNAALLSGILTLEKFYINHGPKKTKNRIMTLSSVEQARHYYMFAMAAYGWKGLNFFGKGRGIIIGKFYRLNVEFRCN